MQVTQQNRQNAEDFLKGLVAKCWEDETFKRNLVAAPVQTIEQLIGKPFELPEGFKLVVTDQSNTSEVHFNIPYQPDLDSVELSDEELEAIAGGTTPPCAIGVYCTLAIAGTAIGTSIGKIIF